MEASTCCCSSCGSVTGSSCMRAWQLQCQGQSGPNSAVMKAAEEDNSTCMQHLAAKHGCRLRADYNLHWQAKLPSSSSSAPAIQWEKKAQEVKGNKEGNYTCCSCSRAEGRSCCRRRGALLQPPTCVTSK